MRFGSATSARGLYGRSGGLNNKIRVVTRKSLKKSCFPLKFGVLLSLAQVRKRSFGGLECCPASSFPYFCEHGTSATKCWPIGNSLGTTMVYRRCERSCVCGAESFWGS
jgi:hypothetical protein